MSLASPYTGSTIRPPRQKGGATPLTLFSPSRPSPFSYINATVDSKTKSVTHGRHTTLLLGTFALVGKPLALPQTGRREFPSNIIRTRNRTVFRIGRLLPLAPPVSRQKTSRLSSLPCFSKLSLLIHSIRKRPRAAPFFLLGKAALRR